MDPNALLLDAEKTVAQITDAIRTQIKDTLKRRGVVLGLSGGIDSSVVAALCVKALGAERVFGIFMPERDSSDDALILGRMLADSLGISTAVENIEPALRGLKCYDRQDEAIKATFPEYESGMKFKLTLPSLLEGNRMNIFRLTLALPSGELKSARMRPESYLQLVAATNFKQRIRKTIEYYHADRLNFAVAGTPNRLEYDQGFFVKQGDGAADLKPIAHLYKTQVYQLAEFLGVPEEIRSRPPTTDTYSLPQTQEEFYFALPYDKMDLCLYARNHNINANEVAELLDLKTDQIEAVYQDIDNKRRTTAYLKAHPLFVEPI
ncbi:MAG: NAD(+) synthase [Methylophilus sp.]